MVKRLKPKEVLGSRLASSRVHLSYKPKSNITCWVFNKKHASPAITIREKAEDFKDNRNFSHQRGETDNCD